ncbi:unnamed protein product [Caenorhabditis sp. 36 PRJEB53466]|nr:unnamed protein product [Caenorhabditis sp. 36 PRJEB53466]
MNNTYYMVPPIMQPQPNPPGYYNPQPQIEYLTDRQLIARLQYDNTVLQQQADQERAEKLGLAKQLEVMHAHMFEEHKIQERLFSEVLRLTAEKEARGEMWERSVDPPQDTINKVPTVVLSAQEAKATGKVLLSLPSKDGYSSRCSTPTEKKKLTGAVCPWCLELFGYKEEQVPLLLGCGHSLCTKCAEKQSENSAYITCPIDSKAFKLGKNRLDGLEMNLDMLGI